MSKIIKKQIEQQEISAINYIEKELIPNHSDFQIQGF
jgi:hypothetical protein